MIMMSVSIEETSKVDIGEIFYKAKTPKEFSYAMKTLTMSQKYHLLTIPKGQLKENTFPTQYLAGCNGRFRLEWLSQHPWMMYSERVDGVFCTACAIFCSDASKSKFGNNKTPALRLEFLNLIIHDF